MDEENNGYMEINDKDLMEINALAEAWTRSVPMETVYEIAKRFHFHFTAHLFMKDRAEFNLMKKVYAIEEEDINRTPQKINAMTLSMIDKLDDIMGFKTMTNEDVKTMEDDTPLPDAEFFKELGLD